MVFEEIISAGEHAFFSSQLCTPLSSKAFPCGYTANATGTALAMANSSRWK